MDVDVDDKRSVAVVNTAISSYFHSSIAAEPSKPWTTMPELPNAAEIMEAATSLPKNRRRGAFESKDAYLETQYNFLRKEATTPLADAVALVRAAAPSDGEDAFEGKCGIYEQIRIIGLRTSTQGIAMRITFSTRRSGKRIQWKQSQRLRIGSLLALTPSKDMFQKKCIVACVAARELDSLELNPHELEIFFARSEELEIDPAEEWTMVEARSSFYTAQRYTMLALQKMSTEPFPLHKQLVFVDRDIEPPQYVQEVPCYNLSDVLPETPRGTQTNLLRAWPESIEGDLDASQQEALHRILTRSLAIIQGPPGTGKTFVSVKALQVLITNRKPDDPPIVVTAQTNHALDQLLRHISSFEPMFARVGGMSKDRDIVLKRTLHNLKEEREDKRPPPGCSRNAAMKKMRDLEKQIAELLSPLGQSKLALHHQILQRFGIITASQAESLEAGAGRWTQADVFDLATRASPLSLWAKDSLSQVPYKPASIEYGFPLEVEELEFEEIQELEAEIALKDDFIGALHGTLFTLADNYTCKASSTDLRNAQQLLEEEADMWKISRGSRGGVYRLLQNRLKAKVLARLKGLVNQYDLAAKQRQIGQFEMDEIILRQQHVIGLTTTGLSRYRSLIASLGCRIILVEEAAETLEAPVTVACIPSLQHLILVGDHQQLRPRCQVREHEGKPLYYNLSLFERLYDNDIETSTLVTQRRMRPEVRRCLRPFYKDVLQDHDCVKSLEDVTGMGGINSWFFSHDWPETQDETMSGTNTDEAAMILGLVQHLVHNGMDTKHMTILTFYNGQRKMLLKTMRKLSVSFKGPIVTVDSYQGEENKVVILSLVRSNAEGNIGFLANDNRVCVALSRAQCGFYVFGNAESLSRASKTWKRVIKIMAGEDKGNSQETPFFQPKRLADTFPIFCSNHASRIGVDTPEAFAKLQGGCRKPCEATLDCGHKCLLLCHPFSHDLVVCTKKCGLELQCGHRCTLSCAAECICTECTKSASKTQQLVDRRGSSSHSSSGSSLESWSRFAQQEARAYSQAQQLPVDRRDVELVDRTEELLIEI